LKIKGEEVSFQNTEDAFSQGISIIYQELNLVDEMSIAENLFLGHMPKKLGVVDFQKMNQDAKVLLEKLGENLNPKEKTGNLSIAKKQMLEIAKALSRGSKIIAFDEPTSSLSEKEVENLFRIIRDLKSKGHAILYVSHRMEEILSLCDAITILRDGKHVETISNMENLTQSDLITKMVGREIKNIYPYRERSLEKNLLQVDHLKGLGIDISLNLKSKEVLGIYGLVGSGRTESLKLIYGAFKKESGDIILDGKKTKIEVPSDAIKAGIMYLSEDRKKEGIIPKASVCENINVIERLKKGLLVNDRKERFNAKEVVKKFKIKTPSIRQIISNLSGGNQQKILFGRWNENSLKVMLLDEPTRGIDVGAKSEIYSLIYDLAEKGIGVIFVSGDLVEVLGVSDRIIVMRDGKIAGEVMRADASEASVIKLAFPGRVNEKNN
ncbi:MAG: ATP-binding cassette domain-containing protein, partial [Bacteriovoracales bacterium]